MTDYFLEIEGHFAMRRNSPFILSAKDWALMKKWREDDIPLPVVLEAIDQVFEKNEASGRRKVINSLSYCRHAVKELWNERKELYVGGEEGAPEQNPGPILESLAERIEQGTAPAGVLAGVAAAVRSLASEKTVPRIEERLIEIEHDMVIRILEAAPADGAAIRDEVARATGTVDEKSRQRTEEANLRRLVRETGCHAVGIDGSPTLIEARCYRFMGHSMSDPVHGVYRTKEEVEEHKELDPIRRFIDQLKEASLLTEEELQAIDARVHSEVDDAAEFAENSPEPTEEELYRHVYAQEDVAGRLYFDGRR